MMIDDSPLQMFGYVLIHDADTREVLVDKANQINFESMSYALALSLGHRPGGNIMQMVFGNGASSVSAVGGISYLAPNVTGTDAQLYNQTYAKYVDDLSPLLNTNPTDNFIRVNHSTGTTYSDVVVTCLLDYNEPSDQDASDIAPDLAGKFIFDELGLKTYDTNTLDGMLLSHVIFHPVQKALNRRIEIIYTIRIVMAK